MPNCPISALSALPDCQTACTRQCQTYWMPDCQITLLNAWVSVYLSAWLTDWLIVWWPDQPRVDRKAQLLPDPNARGRKMTLITGKDKRLSRRCRCGGLGSCVLVVACQSGGLGNCVLVWWCRRRVLGVAVSLTSCLCRSRCQWRCSWWGGIVGLVSVFGIGVVILVVAFWCSDCGSVRSV